MKYKISLTHKDILPRKFSTPLFFTHDEISALQGSQVLSRFSLTVFSFNVTSHLSWPLRRGYSQFTI